MSSIRWCICAALIGTVSNAAVAQQAGPPDPAGPSGGNLRVVSEDPEAPLPPADQPEPVAQPLGKPISPAGMTLAELGRRP